ncbi:hypothetical protein KM043_001283 [Ampulex compressa]|nr:hypothetical protein KM043_001283 [Ampulex compressa]
MDFRAKLQKPEWKRPGWALPSAAHLLNWRKLRHPLRLVPSDGRYSANLIFHPAALGSPRFLLRALLAYTDNKPDTLDPRPPGEDPPSLQPSRYPGAKGIAAAVSFPWPEDLLPPDPSALHPGRNLNLNGRSPGGAAERSEGDEEKRNEEK